MRQDNEIRQGPDPGGTDALGRAFRACDEMVRSADKDRWLAGLFAPEGARDGLMALYAFNLEVAAVRERVSEPLPGEVRLQWWRDVLEGRGEAGGHPVAMALTATLAQHRLSAKPLVDLLEARTFDLYDDAMPTVGDLEGYCGETSSALMQMAALVLAQGRDPGTADLAGHAGLAYALTGLIRAFPVHAARGQVFVPADLLAEAGARREDILAGRATPAISAALQAMRRLARRHLGETEARLAAMPRETAPAFLPVAVCRLYLDRMDGFVAAPFASAVEVPQWRRQWALWRAARRARRGPSLSAPG